MTVLEKCSGSSVTWLWRGFAKAWIAWMNKSPFRPWQASCQERGEPGIACKPKEDASTQGRILHAGTKSGVEWGEKSEHPFLKGLCPSYLAGCAFTELWVWRHQARKYQVPEFIEFCPLCEIQLGVHCAGRQKIEILFVKSDIRKQWDCLGCAGRQKIELLLTIGNKVMASQECSDIYLDLRQFVNSGFKKGGSSVDTDNDANNLH